MRTSTVFIFFIIVPSCIAQDVLQIPAKRGSCDSPIVNAPKEKPLIYGKLVTVPALALQISKNSDETQVRVLYVWRWLSESWPVEEAGAASFSSEELKCGTDKDGTLKIPEYVVKPRGWFNKNTNPFYWLQGIKPKLNHLRIR